MSTTVNLDAILVREGHCGIEKLKYKNDIVVPIPKNEELFIRVKGTGINTIIGR